MAFRVEENIRQKNSSSIELALQWNIEVKNIWQRTPQETDQKCLSSERVTIVLVNSSSCKKFSKP